MFEVRETVAAWAIEPVKSPAELENMIPEGVQLFMVNPATPIKTEEFIEWDVIAQKLKKDRNVTLIMTPGEYRVGDIHMKGSSLDSSTHYVLETPEGSVAFISASPSDAFIKQYSPIDVIVGKDTSLASTQLDLEPFYVVLTELTEEYKKKSGISEIKETDKVNIKKIEQADREGTVSMQVFSL